MWVQTLTLPLHSPVTVGNYPDPLTVSFLICLSVVTEPMLQECSKVCRYREPSFQTLTQYSLPGHLSQLVLTTAWGK